MNPYGTPRYQDYDALGFPPQNLYEQQQQQQHRQSYHQGGGSSSSSGSLSSTGNGSIGNSRNKRARVDPTFYAASPHYERQQESRAYPYGCDNGSSPFGSGKREGHVGLVGGSRGDRSALFEVGYGGTSNTAGASVGRVPVLGGGGVDGTGGSGVSDLGASFTYNGGLAGATWPTGSQTFGGVGHTGSSRVRYEGGCGDSGSRAADYLGNYIEGGVGTPHVPEVDGLEDIRGGIVGGAAAMYGRGAPGSEGTRFASSVIRGAGGRRDSGTSASLFSSRNQGVGDRHSHSGSTSVDYSAEALGYPDVRSGMVGGGYRSIISGKFAGSGDAPSRAGRAGGNALVSYDYDGGGSHHAGRGNGLDGVGLDAQTVVSGPTEYGAMTGRSGDVGFRANTPTGGSPHRNPNRIGDARDAGGYEPTHGGAPQVLTPGSGVPSAVTVAIGDGDVGEEAEADSDGSDDVEPLAGWSEVDGWAFFGLPLEGDQIGEPSVRDLTGPIHVFDGMHKPGKSGWPSDVTWMVSDTYKGSLEGIEWPETLRGIILTGFNRPIANVSWPKGLRELHLRGPFDQAIKDARFPESLTTLSFGARFNQAVEDASFPEGLEGLFFGDCDKGYERALFNQPLAGMVWPPALKQLSTGRAFDQSLEGADWPDSLEVINIMGSKKQPVEDIEWPPGLKQIHLNGRCRKAAPKAAWPRDCKVFAWSLSRKAPVTHPPKPGVTKVGLSSLSGHKMEQIPFDY